MDDVKNRKKVVYTTILDGYDILTTPTVYNPQWDYVVFTDDKKMKSDFWDIIVIDRSEVSKHKLAREFKVDSSYILNNYEESIYMDGNIVITGDIQEWYNKNYAGKDFVIMEHPQRDCIYEESKACIKLKKDTKEIIGKQMARYRKLNYPEHSGLVAAGIIYRKHTKEVKDVCRAWLHEIMRGSHRDQLSFNFVAHEKDFRYDTVPYRKALLGNYFKKHAHIKTKEY